LRKRDRERTGSLAEGDCYDHSYGEGVIGNVDLVDAQSEPPSDSKHDPTSEHHVTSKRLKQQFEARLAARSRRR
jgi:hypothetical protein